MNATRNSNGGERTTLGKRITALFGATTDTTRRSDRRRAMFQLEGLEQRRVMTASAVSVSAAAAEIAPRAAAEVDLGIQLLGTKNATVALNAVFSPTNIGNLLKQKGLGSVAVTQNLIYDTVVDATDILSPAPSPAHPVVSTPVKPVATPSSPVFKIQPPAFTFSSFSTPAISQPTASSASSQTSTRNVPGVESLMPSPPQSPPRTSAQTAQLLGLPPSYGTFTPPSLKPVNPAQPMTLGGADSFLAEHGSAPLG